MAFLTTIYRLIITNLLTVYYSAQILLLFAVNFIKNPFGDPWALKLRLEPPPPLTDPKYGVHKYIKVNNIKLHYLESGDPSKPLMILIHGFPEFWYSWRHQIVDFKKDYWCIAVDMRGYGDSERPEGVEHYKIPNLTADIRDLIKELGREKAILVSHDWGGIIALAFRSTYPELVQGLVVLGSLSQEAWARMLWSDAKQKQKSWYVFMYRMPVIPEKLLQMNNVAILDQIMLVPGKDTITQEDVECYKYWFGKLGAFTPPVNYYRANFDVTNPPKLPRCERKIPFLLLGAANDDFVSPNALEEVKQDFACIETGVIENCGHFLIQEEPALVNKRIREFLVKNKL